MAEITIDIRDLSTGYRTRRGEVIIQRDLTATLRPGEFTCLLGPNGAGKTTLLRTLSGFQPALGGEIIVDGKHLGLYNESELAKTIGVVLTEKPAVNSMTVYQLVSLGRSPYTGFWGRLSGRDKSVIEKALELTGTVGLSNRLVDTLSDGERQRVMVAKALAQQTPAIFLDEPTAFLDFPSKAEMMMLLKNLANEHGNIIFQSTHDINMALTIADRIWLVDKTLGVTIGTPRELADNGALEAYFSRPFIHFDKSNISFHL